MTVHALVRDARVRLGRAGIADLEAGASAELLARQLLGWDQARFLSDRDTPVPDGFPEAYDRLITRRAGREPTSYIVGAREFWGLELDVSSEVLIPRPETELLVETALDCWRHLPASVNRRTIVDAGTGSGCVAIALAVELPDVRLVATDIDAGSLAVAMHNARKHGVSGRFSVVRTDFLAGLRPVGLIACNPPYVPLRQAAGLMPEVREFEPHVALFGGPDGLDELRRVLTQADERLVSGGRLVLEFGLGQEDAVREAAAESTLDVCDVRHDLQDIARTMVLRKP